MSLSKIRCWYSNICLHFLKCTVPLMEDEAYKRMSKFTLELLYRTCSCLYVFSMEKHSILFVLSLCVVDIS